ncbi:MAG: GNAT family N-acetyltransferase [Paenisporosarcina sp.]
MKKLHSKTINPSVRELLSYATSENAIDREYEKYISETNRHLYSWEVNGEAIGCMGIEFINEDHCEIKHIAVSPAARGNGVGRKMIDFICDEYSFELISAETDKDAVEFYRSYGFKITSLGEKYPGVERFLCELKSTYFLNEFTNSRQGGG